MSLFYSEVTREWIRKIYTLQNINNNFQLTKSSFLSLFLVVLCFLTPLMDHVAPLFTARIIAAVQLLFIFFYMFAYREIVAFKQFQTLRNVWYVFLLWLVFFMFSYFHVLVNGLQNQHAFMATQRYLFVIIHLIFLFVIVSFFQKVKCELTRYLSAIPISILVIVATFIAVIANSPNIQELDFISRPPFGTNIRYIGYTCTVGALISCYWLLKSKVNSLHFAIILMIGFINVTFLFWLGGRTAIGAVVVSLVIYVAFTFQSLQKKRIMLLLLILVIALLSAELLSVFSWNGLSRVSDKFAFVGNDINSLDQFSSGRIAIWQLALNAFIESPWLGLGPEGYYFIPDRTFGLHPHNIIIQFLVEWGIISTLAFLSLMIYIAFLATKFIWQNRRDLSDSFSVSFLTVLGLTVHSLTDGTYYHAQPLFYLNIGYSCLICSMQKNKDKAP